MIADSDDQAESQATQQTPSGIQFAWNQPSAASSPQLGVKVSDIQQTKLFEVTVSWSHRGALS